MVEISLAELAEARRSSGGGGANDADSPGADFGSEDEEEGAPREQAAARRAPAPKSPRGGRAAGRGRGGRGGRGGRQTTLQLGGAAPGAAPGARVASRPGPSAVDLDEGDSGERSDHLMASDEEMAPRRGASKRAAAPTAPRPKRARAPTANYANMDEEDGDDSEEQQVNLPAPSVSSSRRSFATRRRMR